MTTLHVDGFARFAQLVRIERIRSAAVPRHGNRPKIRMAEQARSGERCRRHALTSIEQGKGERDEFEFRRSEGLHDCQNNAASLNRAIARGFQPVSEEV
jgi:hypothetical protein